MRNVDCIDVVIARLVAHIVFRNGPEGPTGDNRWVVSLRQDNQGAPCSGYEYKVSLKPYARIISHNGNKDDDDAWTCEWVHSYGSHMVWGNNWRRIVGDGSKARIIRKDDELFLCLEAYDDEYDGPTGKFRLCHVEDIISMGFQTGGGWMGDCYKERIPGSSGQWDDYTEKDWVIILHRSTKSVSICRDVSDLPF